MIAAVQDTRARTSSRMGPHTKHSPRNPCPVCGGKDSYCLTFNDGATICGREPSEYPAGIGYMHWPNGRSPEHWQERLKHLPPPAPRPVVDAELADQAYRALLARLTLSASHRATLHRRGLDDGQIARHDYATSPKAQEGRERLAAEIEREIGRPLAGVAPGFVRGANGRTTLMFEDSELVIPMRDVDGRIHGLRRRPDEPGEKGKYLHFSAGFRPGSIGTDAHAVHVAYPRELHVAAYVVIVEGELKANIAADLLGCIVISVAGVNSIRRVRETVAALTVSDVVIAYDADQATNAKVADAENRLAHDLVAGGCRVARWTWPAEKAKGLDDWLVAFMMPPFPVPHPAMFQAQEAAPRDDEALQRLQGERDAAVQVSRAQSRIQRNKSLNGTRPTAIRLTNLFAYAARAEKPAGAYDGKVDPGYVLASVKTLAEEIGASENSATSHLEQLERDGFIKRMTHRETIPAGVVDPDSGVIHTTPRFYTKHFVAIAGREKERVTPELVGELVERLATFNSGKEEKRGGYRRRCPKHPHAEVRRAWTTYCAICGPDHPLDSDVDVVPAMLLEPLPDGSSKFENPEEDTAAAQSAGEVVSRLTHGIRPIGPKTCEPASAPRSQSLSNRQQEAADDLLRFAEPSPEPPIDADFPPIVPLFPDLEPVAECVDCGASVPPGTSYCRGCDPRGA